MKSDTTRRLKHALRIEPRHLRHLEVSLRERYDQTEWTAKCNDGTTLKPASLDKLLDYENPGFRQIREIVVHADGDEGEHVRLTFDSNATLGTSYFTVQSDDHVQGGHVVDELVKRLREMRPWYDMLSRLNLTTAGFGVLFSLYALAGALLLLGIIPDSDQPKSATADIKGAMTALLIVAVTVPMNYALHWVFPKVVYAIGDQEKVHVRRQRSALEVVGAIVVALLSAWAVSLLRL